MLIRSSGACVQLPGANPCPNLLSGGAKGTAPAVFGRMRSGPEAGSCPRLQSKGAQGVCLLPVAAQLLHLQTETSVGAKLPSAPQEQH